MESTETKQRTLNLFCSFSPDEKAEKGEVLAEKRIRINELKEEAAEINRQKGDLDKELLSLSQQLKMGGEDRFVKCWVRYNHPNDGEKTISRTDTGEDWVSEMTDDDYSILAYLDEEPDPPKVLQLPPASIESVFGFDPGDYDYFIGNTIEDFREHGIIIQPDQLRTFANCLYVKAMFFEIRELVGTEISWQGLFHTDTKDVYWYRFLPLKDLEEIDEAELVDSEDMIESGEPEGDENEGTNESDLNMSA